MKLNTSREPRGKNPCGSPRDKNVHVSMNETPRLAVLYPGTSVSLMEVFEAAGDFSRILWVVGWSHDESSHRALSRFGDVADVTGMSEAESVSHLVALEPEGVVVFNDAPINLAASVARELGLPFHSPYTARLLTDKLAQREALGRAGLSVPAFAAVQLTDVDVKVPFPAVLKPRSGAGGRDTFMVENLDQVHDALAQCNPTEEFILEEWLSDQGMLRRLSSDVVSVESVVRDGVVDHVMVTGRFPFAPPFRETGSFLPSDLGPRDRNDVCALARAAANALQIRHGILHTEIKMTQTGPRVVEVNGRLGGGISNLISRIGGPSMRVWAMRLALGLDIGPIPSFGQSPVAFFRMIVAPESATRLGSVSGVEELHELAGVDEVRPNLQPGDAVDFRHSSLFENVLRVEGMVNSHAELLTLIDEVIPSTLHLTWDVS